MKRFCILLTVILALALCAAQAENNAGESIDLVIGGQSLRLNFDNSPEYSNIGDGYVMASFYAYGDDQDQLYELYMVFPEATRSGDVVTPDFAAGGYPDCCVALLITTRQTEDYYYAGQVNGDAYPGPTSYVVAFDTVAEVGDSRVYTGHLTASLAGMDVMTGETKPTVNIDNAPFSFTMPLGNVKPEATQPPEDTFEIIPEATQETYRV